MEDNGPVDLSLPENIAQALTDADVDNGEALTLSSACIGCHSLDPNQPMPGPTWSNVAITAATRVEGQDADAYLYHSIVNPNEYLVEGFQPNVMLQIYRDTLSDQAIADIIAYLLTLKGHTDQRDTWRLFCPTVLPLLQWRIGMVRREKYNDPSCNKNKRLAAHRLHRRCCRATVQKAEAIPTQHDPLGYLLR